MTFLNPGYLLLLLALPLVWLFPRAPRDLGLQLLRTLVLLMLILALGRPTGVRADESDHQVFIVDLSASAGAGEAAQRLEWIGEVARSLPRESLSTLVTFGAEEQALGDDLRDAFQAVFRIPAGDDASPIADTIALAASRIPLGSRGAITLVSDGLATSRRWGPVILQVEQRGIPVHTVELPGIRDDAFPIRITPLQSLRVGHTASLQVDLHGQARACTLRLDGPDGELVRREDLALLGDTSVVLEFEPSRSGFLELELSLEVNEGRNAIKSNDSLTTLVAVDEARRGLYLGERMTAGRERLGELIGSGFVLDAWDGGELTRQQLAGYDLCVLDDLPRASIGSESLDALSAAVEEDGLGLFASGGKAAFGPGGYHESPVAEILPVEFVQKEEKRDPSTTLVVIIDTSGSMGGNRVQLAKEVARLAIRRLLPHDKVGLVEFYGAKRWAAPIQPASNSIEIERALNRLDAGGGTVILPAIEEAFYGLKNVQTRYKHVLILTDGGVETGAFEPLLRRMAADGINTSTVLIGPEAHSEFLVTLSNWGKGRFYSVPNRFNLPEILLKQPASSKLPAYRPGVHLVEAHGGTGWWGEVKLAELPDLAGYVETRERPGAQVLIETVDGAHPILGSWRYGLGRVTAFTSEPTGPGTEPWRDWNDFGTWMARVLERTASDQREPFHFELERRGFELSVTAHRRYESAGQPRALVLRDDGEHPLEFRQRAPDRFEATLYSAPELPVRVIAEGDSGTNTVRTHLASPPLADLASEQQVDPSQALNLVALAAATGGEHRSFETGVGLQPRTSDAASPLTTRKFWPWFALLALALYLSELYYRRRPLRPIQKR
jgi:Ca-activated chloride channel homolog